MLGVRTRSSLAQFLELQAPDLSIVLINKYANRMVSLYPAHLLTSLIEAIRGLDDRILLLVLGEIASTQSDLRARVSPKGRYDERWHDLRQCLLLDGYIVDGQAIVPTDPSITDAESSEDDLVAELRKSGPRRKDEIIAKIEDSASSFRAKVPDYNASLTNARIALETLAAEIASDVAAMQPDPVVAPSKWGEVLTFLRRCGEITEAEEKGLAGVYGFLSAGAHRPLGIPEDQMARLGRSFALNMCWFLLKNHLARHYPR